MKSNFLKKIDARQQNCLMRRLPIHLTNEDIKRLDDYAKKIGSRRNTLIRQAVREFLARLQ